MIFIKLTIKNIGVFKNEVNLEIGSLTVIAGKNSTGKSTINKIMYAIYKSHSINNLNNNFLVISSYLKNMLFSLLPSSTDFDIDNDNNDNDVSKFVNFYKDYFPDNISDDIVNFLVSLHKKISINNSHNFLDEFSFIEDILNFWNNNFTFENSLFPANFFNDKYFVNRKLRQFDRFLVLSKEFKTKCETIKEYFANDDFDKRILNIYLNTMFENQISNIFSSSKSSSIMIQDEGFVADVSLSNEKGYSKVFKFQISSEIAPFDIFYAESLSTLWVYRNKLNKEKRHFNFFYRQSSNDDIIYSWYKDPEKEVLNSFEILNKIDMEDKKNEYIKNILFNFEKATKFQMDKNYDLTFKGSSEKVKAKNTSRGVSTLQALTCLVQNGFFNSSKIIILDEADNFLHPEWQKEFIRMVFSIIKKTKSKFILTTHNASLIDIIQFYKEANLEIDVKFNLIQNVNDKITINSKSESDEIIMDLNSVYYDLFEKAEKI